MDGLCPTCSNAGAVGTLCPAPDCHLRRIHRIPAAFAQQATKSWGTSNIGAVYGDYLTVAAIGRGAMGRVYRAMNRTNGDWVALKVLHAHRLDQSGRFEQEAIALARLNHPHVVRLAEFGYADEQAYLAMEFVEGHRTVADLIQGQVDYEVVRQVLHQAAAALDHAHQRGFVHRDVKPRNILLETRGTDAHFVRLVDFGLAKFISNTQSTQFMSGTPAYMAPEQLVLKNIGPWTDFYALGVIACQLLTKRKPLGRKSVIELTVLKRDPDQDPIAALGDLDLPPDLVRFFRSSMAFDPRARISTAETFCAELDGAIAAAQATTFTPVLETVQIRLDMGEPTVIQDMTWSDFKEALAPDTLVEPKATVPSQTNLPHRVGCFVGRREALHQVTSRVTRYPLVTLVGPPGVGKSRLAQRFGVEALGRFDGGAWYVDLSNAHTASASATAIASALGIDLRGLDPITEVGEALKARGATLVIFDHLEHLIADTAHVLEQWLDGAPSLRILATSRQPIGLAVEAVYRLTALTAAEAVDLFVARARRIDPEFLADDGVLAQVEEIVGHLDHLPLPIELAVARLSRLSLGQIQRRLQKRMAKLATGGGRGRAAKDTMWQAIDWSWQQLTPLERWVLAQCSVFRGSFSIDAAEAICEANPLVAHRPIREVLMALVEKSLMDGYRTVRGGVRITLLRVVAEYAAHRLTDPTSVVDRQHRPVTGISAVARLDAKYCQYFLGWDPKTDIMSVVRNPRPGRRHIFSDAENTRFAITRALQTSQYPLAAQGCLVAWYGWMSFEGPFVPIAEWCDHLGRQKTLDPRWRGWMHYVASLAWQSAGQTSSARIAADAGLDIVADQREPVLTSLLRAEQATIHAQQGRIAGVMDTYEEALAIQTAAHEPVLAAMTKTRMGLILLAQGSLESARDTLLDALQTHGETQNHRARAVTAGGIGQLHIRAGQLHVAESWFTQALEAFGEVGDQRQIALYRTSLADLEFERGALEKSRQNADTALRISRHIGDAIGEAGAILAATRVERKLGNLVEADQRLRAALGKAELGGETDIQCRILNEIGLIALEADDLVLAYRAFSDALAVGELTHLPAAIRARAALAVVCALQERMDESTEHLALMTEIGKTLPPHIHSYVLCHTAEAHRLQGHLEAARRDAHKASVLLGALGLPDAAPLARNVATVNEQLGANRGHMPHF